MSSTRVRALALAGGVAAVLGVAPAAEAQSPASTLRTSAVTGIPTGNIAPGTDFNLRVTVANRGTRTARGARIFASLRRTNRPIASLPRVGTRSLGPYRAGRSARFSMRVRVNSRRSGTYYLVLCVAQTGRRARCVVVRRIVVVRPTPPAPTPTPPEAAEVRLRRAITQEQLLEHANNLQAVANANGGNRAAGSPGYDASMDYVIQRLVRAGYSPRLDRFDYVQYTENAPAQLTTNRGPITEGTDYLYLEYSGSGDTGTQPVVAVDVVEPPGPTASTSNSGCEAADFAGFPAGAIALMQRGTCDFVVKVQNAADAGAVGAIVYNEGQPGRQDVLNGTLGNPTDPSIPAIGTTYALGQALLAGGSTARIVADTTNTPSSSYNVLADTPGGNADSVIVLGAHLDSVPEGPGINDNGTGTGAILEIAEQMSELKITPANRVRFAFWGAEESGLVGSTDYVATRTDAELAQIKLNLNFDMLGSPNHIKFVYDGDGDAFGTAGPPGSAQIEAAFVTAFAAQGLGTLPTAFDGRSDYDAFRLAGIAAGGLFSGAEDIKTPEQAATFGGQAGIAFDPCYHQACDTIANVNAVGWEQMADVAAEVTARFAQQADLPTAGPRRGALRTRASQGEYLGSHLRR